MKITVIGAGNVGAMTAMRLLESGLCNVVLLDVVEGLAKGKAEDLMDAASVIGHGKNIIGSEDFSLMRDSCIVIIAAGLARKPGMTREDLLMKNAAIIKSVSEKIAKHVPDSIIINVTNPLDAMTYVAYKASGFNPKKVMGMAGLLDSSRMNLLTSRILNKELFHINSTVMGTHGETMVPLLSHCKIENAPVNSISDDNKLNDIVEKTKKRGAEIVSYLKTGSAFFAPSACAAKMAELIIKDSDDALTVSCFLKGEYGLEDIFLGVPAVLGKNGVEKIIEIELNDNEKEALKKAADSVKNAIKKVT